LQVGARGAGEEKADFLPERGEVWWC
jgi:hypothetical protein